MTTGPVESKREIPPLANAGWTGEAQTGDLAAAIAYFHAQLPGWWFSVGSCHVSADASCAPDTAGCDGDLCKLRFFDEGFDVDLHPPATMADALRRVTDIAKSARDDYRQTGVIA